MEQTFKKILWFVCTNGGVKISEHKGLLQLRKELLHQDLLSIVKGKAFVKSNFSLTSHYMQLSYFSLFNDTERHLNKYE